MKILSYITAIIVGVLVVGCSNDLDAPQTDYSKTTLPTLGISIGLSYPSRADEEETTEFEIGGGAENHIDFNDYRIYFFDKDNKYIATFKPFSSTPQKTETTKNGLEYAYFNLTGPVPAGVGVEFKLLFLANWGNNYPEEANEAAEGEYKLVKGQTTIEYICTHEKAQFNALTYPGNKDWLGEGRYIPFYGVRHYNLSEKKEVKPYIKDDKITKSIFINLQNDEEAIPLLRAMARIEVILNNTFATFKSVKLTRSNPKGYCSPFKDGMEWDYRDYFHDYTWDYDFVRAVHIPENKGEYNILEFKQIKENKWVAYVPEYDNTTGNDFTSIEVELNTADSPKKYIYFAENGSEASNNDNKRFNIERNNIYRFTITGMNSTMNVVADIQPYAELKYTFQFGLLRDERGDLKVLPKGTDDEGNLIWDDYFIEFTKKHSLPKEIEIDEEDGNPVIGDDGNFVEKQDGAPLELMNNENNDDYYAIVVGEYENISEAEIWLKDNEGCRVLTNFGKKDGDKCQARLVQDFYGLNESEVYYKDIYGYRRIHHFENNHNSIVISPFTDRLLFRIFTDFDKGEFKYYVVEDWDDEHKTGHIIVYDKEEGDDKKEIGFKKITDQGYLEDTIISLNKD